MIHRSGRVPGAEWRPAGRRGPQGPALRTGRAGRTGMTPTSLAPGAACGPPRATRTRATDWEAAGALGRGGPRGPALRTRDDWDWCIRWGRWGRRMRVRGRLGGETE